MDNCWDKSCRTSREPRGNLAETSPKPLGNLSETSLKPLGNLSETSRKPRGNLAEISRKPLRNLSETFRKPFRNLSETSRKPLGNLSETSRKPFGNIFLWRFARSSLASEQLQKHGLLAVEQAAQQVFTANVAQNCPILPVWLLECPVYQHVVHLLCH